MKRIIEYIKHQWNTPNPEGVTGKDSFMAFWFVIIMFLILSNLIFWLDKPEQSWIGDLLFPLAK